MEEKVNVSNNSLSASELKNKEEDPNYKLKATLFLTSVTGISAVAAFGGALAYARRKDPNAFNRGLTGSKEIPVSGAELALRALKLGTLYAFAGCGIIFYGIWKLSGATNFEEFRMKMGSILPRLSKNDPPQGRTEFKNLTDLLTYVSKDYDEDVKKSRTDK